MRPKKWLIVQFIAGFALASAAYAEMPVFVFPSIEGGEISTADWAGHPVLVVNTASRCGYTGQYDGLQRLYDSYRAAGAIVLAVPSNDFRQELASAEAVKEFCTLNYDLDLPMTDIQPVRGPQAHPFYKWVAAQSGFEPGWNFNKILIGTDGAILGTYGAPVKPMSGIITDAIDQALGRG